MGSKIIEAFDQYAEDYDKWFDSAESKMLFEMEVEAVRLLIKDLEHPFLEVGVGTGRFAKALGIESGVDPSQEVLNIAEKRGIKVTIATGEKLPFEDKSLGGVFILFTLCFVEDSQRVLFEAKRVLKKDGGLIVGIINRESQWGQLYMKKKAEGHHIYKYARFHNSDEVVKMMKKAEMTIEGFSSTLCQPPSENLRKENVRNELIKDAGFVCILARKI